MKGTGAPGTVIGTCALIMCTQLVATICGGAAEAQELAAVSPTMALESQLQDIRLDPKPMLLAQKSKKENNKKKKTAGKDKKASDTSADSNKEQTADSDDASASVDKQAAASVGSIKDKPGGSAAATSLAKAQQFAGNASWYGIPFHGRKTASGEIFNMYKCSAAHKTLPMVTRVLVEDPRTGNTVLVRVNDRGPYVKTRVMDLSREAARRLGTMSRGVYYIEATVLGK